MKSVLLVTNHFYPETFRCNDVAFELASRGYNVSVLTGIPDYPQGKFHSGYGVLRKRKETVRGVTIYRSFLFPRGDGSKFRLVLNYLSSFVCMTVRAVTLALTHKYDSVLVHETSPVMVGTPAMIVSRLQRIPMHFWVLDLWPESLRAAGGVNNQSVLNFFGRMTTRYYKYSRKILISSLGFEQSICEKGDFKDKIVYFPNWSDKDMRPDHRLECEIPEGFVVMFAGNVGEAQDFESIAKAALMIKDTEIKFVIVGDGRKMPWIRAFIEEHNLSSSVYLLGRHPVEMMPSFFSKADVLLVSLKNDPIFNLTLPAKVQAYMSVGKPIVAMMNGEGARVIKEANCGFTVPSGEYISLAETIIKASQIGQLALKVMGDNALKYSNANFSYSKCMDNLINIIES